MRLVSDKLGLSRERQFLTSPSDSLRSLPPISSPRQLPPVYTRSAPSKNFSAEWCPGLRHVLLSDSRSCPISDFPLLTPQVIRTPTERQGGRSRRAAAPGANESETGSELTRLDWAGRGLEDVVGTAARDSGTWGSTPSAAAMPAERRVETSRTGTATPLGPT